MGLTCLKIDNMIQIESNKLFTGNYQTIFDNILNYGIVKTDKLPNNKFVKWFERHKAKDYIMEITQYAISSDIVYEIKIYKKQ